MSRVSSKLVEGTSELIGEILFNKLMACFENAPQRLMICPEDDLRIYIPEPLIEHLITYCRRMLYLRDPGGTKITPERFTFRGIRVLPGYESKVVLVHKDYVYQKSLIVSVDIE